MFGPLLFTSQRCSHPVSQEPFDRHRCLLDLAGFGNNAVEMQTRADFDAETDEWVVTTPTTLAQKYWITNGKLGAPSLPHDQYTLLYGDK